MIRSLLIVGMTLSAFAFADEMNQGNAISRRAKQLPQTFVIEIDRKNPNKIRVAHVKDELQVGDKRVANLVFEKMGLGDQATVVAFAEDHDPMQTSGTPAARAAFAGIGRGGVVGGRPVWGGGRPGLGYGRPGIGRPGLGYGPRYPYARGYARGAYWGARYGYGAGYGTGYYNAAGYYNNSLYYGGYTDPNAYYGDGYYDEGYGAEAVYSAGYAPIYSDYAYAGCGSYCGGAWARPFYNYYGYYYPYRPYYSWASPTSYYVYCRPWSWWG